MTATESLLPGRQLHQPIVNFLLCQFGHDFLAERRENVRLQHGLGPGQ